jgi:putative membrane protein
MAYGTMWHGQGWAFGAGLLSWGFWVLVIVLLVILVVRRFHGPDPRSMGTTPLEILKRRYAAGEISTEEFEERKARLAGNPR